MSNELSTSTSLTTMKLITIKGHEHKQLKHFDKVEALPRSRSTVDLPPLASSVRVPSSTDKSRKTPSTETPSAISRKHKHHHHHHHHGRKHHCHHHRQHRAKSAEAVRDRSQSIVLSPSKVIVANPSTSNTPNSRDNETAVVDHQQKGLAHPNAASVPVRESLESKSNKGNIPLQSIENSMRSQRVAPASETQVGNYPTCIDMGGLSQIDPICCDDSCYLPSSNTNCFINSCIVPQSDPVFCAPQQPLLYCSDGSSTDYLCSPSTNNIIQSSSFIQPQQQQQQQYICLSNNSSAIQPTVINQLPVMNSISTQSAPQQFLCIPQTGSIIMQQQPQAQQQSFQIVQQQPQMQQQPFQIIQAPQQQTPQYIQISSATPQLIQSIQPPSMGQNIQASPQLLYQRPYDPIVVPVQNQQIAIGNAPLAALSQPSYAPTRLVSATSDRRTQGPQMFRQALVRTVASRTGMPLPFALAGGGQSVQSPMFNSVGSGALQASSGSLRSNNRSFRPASLPFVPLTAGGLLIPFQPSMPATDKRRGPLSRIGGYPSNLSNFDRIREQIRQRGQLLESLQRQNNIRMPSLPVVEANTMPSPSVSLPRVTPALSVPSFQPARFSSAPATGPSSSPFPRPPPLIQSQSPYSRSNDLSSSSSSSAGSSSSSSARPASSGLPYAQPSIGDSRPGSLLSGPSNTYRALQ